MRATPVDLIGGYYTDDALSWSCQDTVNWLPVMAEVAGTKTPKKLSTPPGLKPYQQIGTGPIRGMHDLEGGRFVVSGRYLFRITPAGVGVPVGVIPGVGRVSMTHNQFKTGYQLLVENGQGGGGYVYTSSTDTFAKITDEGYPGSISSDYLDSYLLGVEPQGRYWFHSNLADATDYNTLDRYEAEAAPDRIVGLIVSAQEVVVFSQRTTEFFYNTGQATGTFQKKKCGFDRGCASRHTIKKLDNSPIWLGDDGVVYRLDGYSAVPISTRPIEKALAGQNWAEAFAHTWEDRGFKIYYLTLPDGRTWGYDVVSRLWTRRESPGLRRWRLMDTIRWGGKWYGGDFQDGRIWELNWDYYLEGDEEFVSERTSPCLQDSRSSLIVPFAELEFDVGQGPMTEAIPFPEQPVGPTITGDAPNGIVGFPYDPYAYTVTPGSSPIQSFAVVSGSLPEGMVLNQSGVISAVSLELVESKTFTIRVTDQNGLYAEVTDTVNVGVKTVGDVFDVLLYAGNAVQPRVLPTVRLTSGGAYMGRVRGADWSRLYVAPAAGAANEKSFSGTVGMNPSTTTLSGSSVSIGVALLNESSKNYFGYVFGNSAGFARAISWVGDGSSSRTIQHDLGVPAGAIFISAMTAGVFIDMYHRSLGETKYLRVNGPQVPVTAADAWSNTSPTASEFTVGARYNQNGTVYSALVLAHDASPDGMIQCGSYVGNGTAAGPSVALGWQPQMLMIKGLTGGDNQFVTDSTRSPGFTGNDELAYMSLSNNVSASFNLVQLIAGGFRAGSSFGEVNDSGTTYIYVAVRAENG